MTTKFFKRRKFLILLILISVYSSCFSQTIRCVDNWALAMHTSIYGIGNLPTITVRPVIQENKTKLLVHYYGFHQTLLDDQSALNFELIDVNDRSSKIITISLDTFLQEYRGSYRYILNDFYMLNNNLYLLIDRSLHIFSIQASDSIKYVKKIKLSTNYDWFKMTSQTSGVFIQISQSKILQNNSLIHILKLSGNKEKQIKKELKFAFNGPVYLSTDNHFISDLNNKIVIGNATSSDVTFYNQKKPSKKEFISFEKSIVTQSPLDSLTFMSKEDFFGTLFNSDTLGYHYQTAYFGDTVALFGRSLNKLNCPQHLDVYVKKQNTWKFSTTILDGDHNHYNYLNKGLTEFNIMFNPISSPNDRCFIGNKLYQIGTYSDMTQRDDGTYFSIPEQRLKQSKTMRNTSDYKFKVYEYEIR